jgi:hypothetical protein
MMIAHDIDYARLTMRQSEKMGGKPMGYGIALATRSSYYGSAYLVRRYSYL